MLSGILPSAGRLSWILQVLLSYEIFLENLDVSKVSISLHTSASPLKLLSLPSFTPCPAMRHIPSSSHSSVRRCFERMLLSHTNSFMKTRALVMALLSVRSLQRDSKASQLFSGVGFFFAAIMLILTTLQRKFFKFSPASSEEFTVCFHAIF